MLGQHLDPENFRGGYLRQGAYMCGVSEDLEAEVERRYLVYMIDLNSGDMEGAHQFSDLQDAIRAAYRVLPEGVFESYGSGCNGQGCTEGGCGEGECRQQCGGGECPL